MLLLPRRPGQRTDARVTFDAEAVLEHGDYALLFGVRPLDPVTFAAVLGVLAATAAASVTAPAWRAARLDPAGTLRSE